MKKLLSILFAVAIVLSGMHFTVSTHYCGGVVAATKVSVSGELASCGMEGASDQCQFPGKHIRSNCCTDKISVFAIENNFVPSFSEFKSASQNILQIFVIPASFRIHSLSVLSIYHQNISPPGNIMVSAVSLLRICVFRI
ncbi:MAG: hypothetical protein WCL21_15480 [Mariniphaga sp.]